MKNTKGITLIALVITIIVLLILAGVSLSTLVGEKGIANRAKSASAMHSQASAREKLELALSDAQIEKMTNLEYNQDDYLDSLIKSEVSGVEIKGDVAIVDGYSFELDRSVPKIGAYVGLEKDLTFPIVTVSKPQVLDNNRISTFSVTAIENSNGISKIEIWLKGEKINTLDKTYNNINTEITESFTVNKNGIYTVKVYAELMASATVEVSGLVTAVEFSPNGNPNWQKEHSTTVTMPNLADKVTSAKYCWTNSQTQPAESSFTENFSNGGTITYNGVTGTYYVWCLLKTIDGDKIYCRSEGFNLDNQAPNASLASEAISETSFKLTATASDENSEVSKYEFYVDETLASAQSENTYTWIGTCMAEKNCYVIVTDTAGNTQRADIEAKTKLHTWEVWDTRVTGTKRQRVLDTELSEFELISGSYDDSQQPASTANPVFKNDTSLGINASGTFTYSEDGWLPGWAVQYRWYGNTGSYTEATCVGWAEEYLGSYKGTGGYNNQINYRYRGYVYQIKDVTTREKGYNLIGTETSANENEFPKNDILEIKGQEVKFYKYLGIK